MVSNDWSPPCIPPRQVHRQHTHTARSEASQWHTVVLHTATQQSTCFLASCWLVSPCSAQRAAGLSPCRRGEEFFRLLSACPKPLQHRSLCAALLRSPGRQLASLQFQAKLQGGSNSSRKTPTMGCESPAVPVNLGPICELRWRNSL